MVILFKASPFPFFCSASSFFTSLWIRSLLWHTLEHQRVCETVVVTSARRWPNRLLLLRLSFRCFLLFVTSIYTDMIYQSRGDHQRVSHEKKRGEEFRGPGNRSWTVFVISRFFFFRRPICWSMIVCWPFDVLKGQEILFPGCWLLRSSCYKIYYKCHWIFLGICDGRLWERFVTGGQIFNTRLVHSTSNGTVAALVDDIHPRSLRLISWQRVWNNSFEWL